MSAEEALSSCGALDPLGFSPSSSSELLELSSELDRAFFFFMSTFLLGDLDFRLGGDKGALLGEILRFGGDERCLGETGLLLGDGDLLLGDLDRRAGDLDRRGDRDLRLMGGGE